MNKYAKALAATKNLDLSFYEALLQLMDTQEMDRKMEFFEEAQQKSISRAKLNKRTGSKKQKTK